jgi:hypothetical protein
LRLSAVDARHEAGRSPRAERTDKTIDPALPLHLARARREVDEAFRGVPDPDTWFDSAASSDLVSAGLSALARWLKDDA